MRTFLALPALFRVGLAKASAYRAETFIWVLTSTMPLIMLPLWHAVAEEAPVGGFGQRRFTAYFLAAFVVRQVVGAWASWTLNYEIRSGAMNHRLLRPIHPFWMYATENLASIPLRAVIALPIGLLALLSTEGTYVARDLQSWLMLPLALVGAWAISFLAHVTVGALSLWTHQSIKVMDVWTAGFFVFSGYLVPVALFPEVLRGIPAWLPWQYQLGYPVELLNGTVSGGEALRMLGVQWAWVAALGVLASTVWTRGIRRYGAYGG